MTPCSFRASASKSALIILFSGLAAFALPYRAAVATTFNFIGEVTAQPVPPIPGLHGIARVGTDWFVANFNQGWNVYDSNFVQTATTAVPGLGQTRALTLDSVTGNLFVGDYLTNTIFEVTPTGTIVNSFAAGGSFLNALAYDPNDNSLYAVNFDGLVNHLTTAGIPLNNFTIATDQFTGAAFDSVSNTLLLLTSTDDSVNEYKTSGAFVGIPLVNDAVTGNGQGLAYDSTTGVLHVTSQEGVVAVWQRRVVPEPEAVVLAMLGAIALLTWVKRGSRVAGR
jgi:hypothetical protein